MLLLVDGDVIAYKSCDARWKDKAVKRGGTNVVSLDHFGDIEPIEFSAEEDAKYLEKSWKQFKRIMSDLHDRHFTDQSLIAVKGPDNFRDDIFSEYKKTASRSANPIAPFVHKLRERAVEEFDAVMAYGREADDLLRIWAAQAEAAGDPYTVVSIDKDLLCIPGRHHLLHKDTIITIDRMQAMRNYYAQLLKGDGTDNIPGCAGIGEVKSQKAVALCATEEEFQEAVVANYIATYGDEWYPYLLANGKLIHLQRHVNDYFTVSDWPVVKTLL